MRYRVWLVCYVDVVGGLSHERTEELAYDAARELIVDEEPDEIYVSPAPIARKSKLVRKSKGGESNG